MMAGVMFLPQQVPRGASVGLSAVKSIAVVFWDGGTAGAVFRHAVITEGAQSAKMMRKVVKRICIAPNLLGFLDTLVLSAPFA